MTINRKVAYFIIFNNSKQQNNKIEGQIIPITQACLLTADIMIIFSISITLTSNHIQKNSADFSSVWTLSRYNHDSVQ